MYIPLCDEKNRNMFHPYPLSRYKYSRNPEDIIMKHSALIVATLAGLFSFGAMASTSAPAVSATHSGITATKADNHAKTVKHEAKVKNEKGKKAKKVKEEKQSAI